MPKKHEEFSIETNLTLIAEGLIRCARVTQTKIISATNRLLLEALRLR